MERKTSEQEEIRRNKIAELEKNNLQAFHKTMKPTANSKELNEKYKNLSREDTDKQNTEFVFNGRIMTIRGPFIVLQDNCGQMQIYANKKTLNESSAKTFSLMDFGDILSVRGTLSKTNTDALVMKAQDMVTLTKSLKPLPDKFHGLVDPEERRRQRYVDLMMNEKTRNTFVMRTQIIKGIREYFDSLNYIEVDTPILNPMLGGAAAKPFITFYNATNRNFYLRIATELPLKKLIVGGLDRVYEIGRMFRNEGVDTTHNPEFTSIEFYEAYSDLWGMMERTEGVFKHLMNKFNIKEVKFNGFDMTFNFPFKRVNMIDAMSEKINVDIRKLNEEQMFELAKKHGIKIEKFFRYGHIINELFEKYVEETLMEPTFVYGHPIEISPTAAIDPDDKRFTTRAETFIGTKEFANMFTELNDPIDQLQRFENQLLEKENGNEEANEIDWDFVNALEYGMPPTGGSGMGIDRTIMTLTQNDSIRDVVLFPQLKDLK
nr:putative lysyl-tRNA synthetase [Metamycoplasma hominis ATCC 23114]